MIVTDSGVPYQVLVPGDGSLAHAACDLLLDQPGIEAHNAALVDASLLGGLDAFALARANQIALEPPIAPITGKTTLPTGAVVPIPGWLSTSSWRPSYPSPKSKLAWRSFAD
jgi:hypothetical protein